MDDEERERLLNEIKNSRPNDWEEFENNEAPLMDVRQLEALAGELQK